MPYNTLTINNITEPIKDTPVARPSNPSIKFIELVSIITQIIVRIIEKLPMNEYKKYLEVILNEKRKMKWGHYEF